MPEPTTIQRVQANGGLGTFERYLSVWVALCMGAGIAIGKLAPAGKIPEFLPFVALRDIQNMNHPVFHLEDLLGIGVLSGGWQKSVPPVEVLAVKEGYPA